MPHRLGLIPADPQFVRALREWTRKHGTLLIVDEVITFRMEYGGFQDRYDVRPDLTALGKIIVYRQKGYTIPEGWAFDAEGRPTTDPAAAIAGLLARVDVYLVSEFPDDVVRQPVDFRV